MAASCAGWCPVLSLYIVSGAALFGRKSTCPLETALALFTAPESVEVGSPDTANYRHIAGANVPIEHWRIQQVPTVVFLLTCSCPVHDSPTSLRMRTSTHAPQKHIQAYRGCAAVTPSPWAAAPTA